jgi:uncharacterized protein (TIGR02646 family)
VRRIARSRLATEAQAKLDALRTEVHDGCNAARVAARLWENRTRGSAFEQVRDALTAMAPGAPGVARCMYCNANEAADIDHFRPLARYPGHAFVWSNLLLACSICNSHTKRDVFPLDEEGCAVLLDPTWDDPPAHLDYSVATGRFEGFDRRGSVSVATYDLNGDALRSRRRALPAQRMKAWRALCHGLRRYDDCLAQGRSKDAELERIDLLTEPFASLLVWLVRLREELPHDLREIIERRGVAAWVRGW